MGDRQSGRCPQGKTKIMKINVAVQVAGNADVDTIMNSILQVSGVQEIAILNPEVLQPKPQS